MARFPERTCDFMDFHGLSCVLSLDNHPIGGKKPREVCQAYQLDHYMPTIDQNHQPFLYRPKHGQCLVNNDPVAILLE